MRAATVNEETPGPSLRGLGVRIGGDSGCAPAEIMPGAEGQSGWWRVVPVPTIAYHRAGRRAEGTEAAQSVMSGGIATRALAAFGNLGAARHAPNLCAK